MVLAAVSVVCPRGAPAAEWTWDASGNGSTFDGPGTWDTASNWWDGATDQVWASGNDAVFGAGISAAGTVNLTAPTAVGNLTFNVPGSGSYKITGSALQLGTDPNWVNVNQNAEIDSTLTGALRVRGNGTLTLGGGVTRDFGSNRIVIGDTGVSGRVVQNDGLVQTTDYLMVGGNAVSNASGEYVINGGTLSIGNGIYLGWTPSNSGTLTQNGGLVQTINPTQALQVGVNGGYGTYNLNGGTLFSDFAAGGDPYTYQTFNFGGGLFKAFTGMTALATMTTTIAPSAYGIHQYQRLWRHLEWRHQRRIGRRLDGVGCRQPGSQWQRHLRRRHDRQSRQQSYARQFRRAHWQHPQHQWLGLL